MNLRVPALGAVAAFVLTTLFVLYPTPYLMALFTFVAQPLFLFCAVFYLRRVFRELREKEIVSRPGREGIMSDAPKWYLRPSLWLEAFVLVNLGFLSLDIYLAHSVNQFRHAAEYVPLYFSLAAPAVLLVGLVLGERFGLRAVWRDLGYLVGWGAVGVGLVGTVLHLDSRFFWEHTLKSLVYAAPFAAPLAYTGLGLLLIMNRMVEPDSKEWSLWVILLALGGFVGNFIFSLTDHAQNSFFHAAEWIPVVAGAFAVGFLLSPFLTPATRSYLWLCGLVLVVQAVVGLLGFYYHVRADLDGASSSWFQNFVEGAPSLAPLLFPNLSLLAGIGLIVLARHLPENAESALVVVTPHS